MEKARDYFVGVVVVVVCVGYSITFDDHICSEDVCVWCNLISLRRISPLFVVKFLLLLFFETMLQRYVYI